jgi:glutamyl-tRNA synthetase
MPAPDGRFAPSPTGTLHLGNLRTALLAWLFARSQDARFLVRMEDLDTGRVRARHYDEQLADLGAIGLDWDGPVVRQSDRLDLYAAAVEALAAQGLVYECWCTRAEIREAASAPHGRLPEGFYPGTCLRLTEAERAARRAEGRPPALRVRADAATVTFEDRVAGEVSGAVDDFVVRRNDGAYAYNLAVVVDDAAQGIGEVVRGADLLDSTPRQLWLGARLGLPAPLHAHVPLMLGDDGARLAKRHGAVTLADRIALGETADDVRALLAGSVGLAEPAEAVSPADLVARFSPDVLAAPAEAAR